MLRRLLLMMIALTSLIAGVVGVTSLAMSQERPPPDSVAALLAQLKAGAPPIPYRPGTGYLPGLLERLEIPQESQILVFSKTSLQTRYITPKTPRSIYFNDTVAVGTIPGAPLFEVAAVGRDGRTRFYSLQTAKSGDAILGGQEENGCQACHLSVRNPSQGMVIGSVIALPDGQLAAVTTNDVTDGRTPFEERWGGWYVTGQHGAMKHMGNVVADSPGRPRLDPEAGQNITDLSRFFDTKAYLRPTSDIVALMTLEHQIGFNSLAAKLNVQIGRDYPSEDISETTAELADYLLGADEAPMTAPITGTSGFSQRFSERGPRDLLGRSLREYDLRSRLFRYPLSFMIYSSSFDNLEPSAKAEVYRRLVDVLTGAVTSPKYARLAEADRKAALEIVAATKADLPDFWPGRRRSPGA